MIAPQADTSFRDPEIEDHAEVDLWWGSFAGRAMAPSFAVCIVLTIIIYIAALWLVRERGWVQLTFVILAGLVWIVQLIRWGKRFFMWNHRLTTRNVYIDRGWTRLKARRIPLPSIASVTIRRRGLARILGIGDIVMWLDDAGLPPAVLVAVTNPHSAAETIREAIKNAKEAYSP